MAKPDFISKVACKM